jgi:hypothetical protein
MNIILHEANGLKIGQRCDDGYINLSKMAQASGKLIADYLRLGTTSAFIAELSRSMGIPIDLLILKITGGSNNKRGTWGHPQVAIHCAQWCSPKFAVLVSRWVVDWMTTGKRPISQTENYADSLLPTAKAYIESSQALNRTIHTAIHQQTDSLKQALESLFNQETPTPCNSASTNFSVCQNFAIEVETPKMLTNELFTQLESELEEPRIGRPKGKRSDPDYEQVTAYIKSGTYTNVKIELLKEGQKREFSELIQELLDNWLNPRS